MLLEELGQRSVANVVIVEVFVALLSADGLKAELFELNFGHFKKATYPFSKELLGAFEPEQGRHYLVLDAALILDVDGVALFGPCHHVFKLLVLQQLSQLDSNEPDS